MSPSFSFKRLIQLIQKQWVENARLYLLSLATITFVLGLIHFFWIVGTTRHFDEGFGFGLYWFGLFLCGSIFASNSFGPLGNKEKGTYWLAFPASHGEKFANVLFYNLIVFTLSYTLVFLLVHNIAMAYVKYLIAASPSEYILNPMKKTKDYYQLIKGLTLLFIGIQALYILGSIYFNRFNYILTTLAFSIIFTLFAYFTFKMGKAFFTGHIGSMGPEHMTVYDNRQGKEFIYDSFVYNFYKYVAQYIWAPVFYVITWFRLKEKQV